MPQIRGHRRKHSRSLSPVPSKHKRSWQNVADERFGREGERLPQRRRSPSPDRGPKKDFRSPVKPSDRRNYQGSHGALRKSRSPHSQKRPRPGSPISGRGASLSYSRHSQVLPAGSRDKSGVMSHHSNDRSGSVFKQRSLSQRPQQGARDDRNKRDAKVRRLSPDPGPSTKKKSRHSAASLSPLPKRSKSRSPVSSLQIKNESVSALNPGNSTLQRKVSTSSKKKPARITLHKRFTFDDQYQFELEENVTIAILRKPDAQPSEDVTVKRVFDSSQFKMIHKKTEGRKRIFDREEIKVWRHDENLADDPDYERRLVRVKSTSATSKSVSDNLSRMSPDVIRKAFGAQDGGRSDKSPMEPQIRFEMTMMAVTSMPTLRMLVPRPDPRYESKFRQQIEREEELGKIKSRGEDKRGGVGGRSAISGRGGKGAVRERRWGDDKRGDRGREETYDLRQALERRRNDREEGTFRIEVRRDSNPEAQLFYRDSKQRAGSSTDHRRFVQDSGADRSVVLDQDRARRRFSGSVERDAGRSWENRRFGDSRGRPGRGRGRRRDWSGDRGEADGEGRNEGMTDFRDGGRNYERRQRYSISPSNTRGWRGGFRGRGRGRMHDYTPFHQDLVPTEIDDSFKYSQVRNGDQHDDRDVSPKSYRGRGGRGRFVPRSFGGNSFRALSRGVLRGGGRTYRGGYMGGGFGSQGDRGTLDRVREVSVDREWKHDMYDSLLTEEEQPHSITGGT